MFLCKPCHDKAFKLKGHKYEDHFAGHSFGPCEDCRKYKDCVDCHAHTA